MENNIKIEDISLDIANYWTSNNFLTESNKNCGTLVAFDWIDDYLTEFKEKLDLTFDILDMTDDIHPGIKSHKNYANKLKEIIKVRYD